MRRVCLKHGLSCYSVLASQGLLRDHRLSWYLQARVANCQNYLPQRRIVTFIVFYDGQNASAARPPRPGETHRYDTLKYWPLRIAALFKDSS